MLKQWGKHNSKTGASDDNVEPKSGWGQGSAEYLKHTHTQIHTQRVELIRNVYIFWRQKIKKENNQYPENIYA